jgi:hypothetical protein
MPKPIIEAAIRQLLLNQTAISAVVGTRIHLGRRPQNDTLPAIVVNLLDSGEDHDIEETEDHHLPQIIVDCYATSYIAAADLARLVRAIVPLAPITVAVKKADNTDYGSLLIDAITVDDEATIPSDPVDGSETPTFGRGIALSLVCEKA